MPYKLYRMLKKNICVLQQKFGIHGKFHKKILKFKQKNDLKRKMLNFEFSIFGAPEKYEDENIF